CTPRTDPAPVRLMSRSTFVRRTLSCCPHHSVPTRWPVFWMGSTKSACTRSITILSRHESGFTACRTISHNGWRKKSDFPKPPPPHLDDYAPILGQAQIDTLRFLAKELKGKTIKMVNSTAVGGGVAEMLNRLVPLLTELEVPTHWDVITGGNDFFEITKAFHNALHGGKYDLSRQAQEVFLATNAQNRQRLSFDEDVIVINDHQPIDIVCSQTDNHQPWIWRCHI